LGRSEEITGECLKDYRENVVVATKVWDVMGTGPNESGLSRFHVMQQIKASLKRLQMDHIDLYQIHRWDYRTPIEETMVTLNDIVRQGMARYIGASSMFAWQFLSALNVSEKLGLEKLVSMQNHYNLVYREEEREMIPLCKDAGVGIIPWSPLARGFLTGKYSRGKIPKSVRYENERMDGRNLLADRYFRPEDFDVVEALVDVAKEKDVSPSQVALAWLLHKGVTAPIIGATKVQHVEEAVAAIGVRLDSEDIRRLEAPYKPHPITGHE
jgi:aryl-alcohol dehydrogenase-like predicted oxidoreductase